MEVQLNDCIEIGLNSTMDNMDDHPSSSIGLEGVWMVIHGSSVGPWMAVWSVLRRFSIDNLRSKLIIHRPLLDIDDPPYCA